MEIYQAAPAAHQPYTASSAAQKLAHLKAVAERFYMQVKFLGYSQQMENYEQRKLQIFNQINFLQVVAGIMIPLLGLLLPGKIPLAAWVLAAWPSTISMVVLALNFYRKYEAGLLTYFFFYPLCSCLVYLSGINSGVDLYFIFFIILSVFFLQERGYMLFAIGFSMISFFVLSVLVKHFIYETETASPVIYLLNKLVSLAFIFYGLFLIKRENGIYQHNILTKQQHLADKNKEIEKQKEIISEKAGQLQLQKEELTNLNTFKNKLFSIISHDLKSPMYAVRNLFQNMQQYNLPAEEIKEMVPEVLIDLNYTTALMENLLQWAKSQMQADAVHAQNVAIGTLVADVVKLLRLQMEAKKISIEILLNDDPLVYADKDMIHLVVRNLLSNAIKFTPVAGRIKVGITNHSHFIEVYVADSGMGITDDALDKIKQKIFYTTAGTSSETGTGLGLMLCHEFLQKNNSRLQIESTVGKGSIFSFTLPTVNEQASAGC